MADRRLKHDCGDPDCDGEAFIATLKACGHASLTTRADIERCNLCGALRVAGGTWDLPGWTKLLGLTKEAEWTELAKEARR